MLSIDELAKEYQTVEEWKAFATAQQKQVASLSKKIKELEVEKKDLKKQLTDVPTTKVIDFPGQSNILLKSDVETIAQVQLVKLKEISYERELTLEEAKRVEIFNKVLISNKVTGNDIGMQGKELTEAELIGLLADDTGK